MMVLSCFYGGLGFIVQHEASTGRPECYFLVPGQPPGVDHASSGAPETSSITAGRRKDNADPSVHDDGPLDKHLRSCGGFAHALAALVAWLVPREGHLVGMASTGLYGKNLSRVLDKADIAAPVGNARHVTNVPGRKTALCASAWLAPLGQALPGDLSPRPRLVLHQMEGHLRSLASELAPLGPALIDAMAPWAQARPL